MQTTAFFLVLSAAAFHASWNFVAKKISGNMEALWGSTVVSSIFGFPPLFFLKQFSIPLHMLVIMLGVSMVHALYIFFLGKAYESGEISSVYPIARGLGVAGTAFFGYLLLSEHLSLLGIFGVILTVLGILLTAKAKIFEHYDRAFFYAVTVGLMVTTYSLVARTVVQVVHPILYNFFIGIFSMIFFMPLVYFHRKGLHFRKTWRKYKTSILYIGILSPFTYLIVLFALALSPAGYVVATRESGIVFGALLGFFLLREKFTWRKGIGILTILSGVMLIKFA